MSERKKRTYQSETRNAQASQTRSRILTAAKELFLNEGFDRVTINQLANAASVSAPTIYAVFKSKRGVLQALIDEALPPQQFASLVDSAMSEKSPKKRLEVAARMARQIYDAERELMDIMRGAAVVAPEIKELEQQREQRRYDRQSDSVQLMVEENSLAPGLTAKKARDILWALTGRDLYRLLVIEREWSSDSYEQWLGDTLIRSLLS